MLPINLIVYNKTLSLNNFVPTKSNQDNHKIINSKSINNDIKKSSYNSNCKINCNKKPGSNYSSNFLKRPINHYRKQYNSSDTGFSNISFIGSLDKPASNIITQNNDCSIDLSNNGIITNTFLTNNTDRFYNLPINKDKFYDVSNNKLYRVSWDPENLVIKTASTVIDNRYSASNSEYLRKKKLTFNDNLPKQYDSNTEGNDYFRTNRNCIIDCKDGKKVIFNPSNNRYQTQGPISSSARIASLKYGTNNEYKRLQINSSENKNLNIGTRKSYLNDKNKETCCKIEKNNGRRKYFIP